MTTGQPQGLPLQVAQNTFGMGEETSPLRLGIYRRYMSAGSS